MMKTSWLIWQITWRSVARGVLLGALFGGIYGASFLIVLFFGRGMLRSTVVAFRSISEFLNALLLTTFVGAFIGGLLGVAVGILLGLLISVITIRLFMPLDDTPRYLRVVQLSSTILCGIGAFVGTSLLLGGAFGMVYSEVAPLLIFCIFPTLLASLASWRSSRQIAAGMCAQPTPMRRWRYGLGSDRC